MTPPGTLAQLAGWDVAATRGGVAGLARVAEGLPSWRVRLDELGRRLGTAECWSGPAGDAAAAALVELSTVASGVFAALDASRLEFDGLAAAAAEAQEWAASAFAAAAAAGVTLDGDGVAWGAPAAPTSATAADQRADVLAARDTAQVAAARAEEALSAAGRALACARAAQQPLGRLGVADPGPAGFADLAVRLDLPGPPPLPLPREPQSSAAWWTSLTAAQQLAEIGSRPGTIGALDGLPAWARDRANRLRLTVALDDPRASWGERGTAAVVAAQLAEHERAGRTVQLLQFEPAPGWVAIALGDLDTAAAVGVLVPGINTTPDDDLPGLLDDAAAVGRAAGTAAPAVTVATVAWLGYRTPGLGTMTAPRASWRGGPALDRALDGLAAAREASPLRTAPRTTVIAHSYGTVVAGQAVRAPGELAADALVLLGSPGLTGGEAADLEAEEVYGAWSPADPISWLNWFGDAPSDASFGDRPLPVELTEGHTDYYDPDRPTLAAIGQVVAGVRGTR